MASPTLIASDDQLSEDRALVARLKDGDADAYEDVMRLYSSRLLAVARRLLGDEEEAHDAFQEALLSAFRNIGGFNGEARLSTWLHRVVVNASLMRIRSRKRKAEEPLSALMPQFADDGDHAEPVSLWDLPDRELERQQVRRLVRSCIDRLPDAYRTVIVMRDIEELSTEETASALGVTPNAAKIRLHRARQALGTLVRAALAVTMGGAAVLRTA